MLNEMIACCLNLCTYTMLISRYLLEKNGIRFYEGMNHEDLLFTPQIIAAASNVLSVRENYYFRRFRNNSIVTTAISASVFDGHFISACELMARLLGLKILITPMHFSHSKGSILCCRRLLSKNFRSRNRTSSEWKV